MSLSELEKKVEYELGQRALRLFGFSKETARAIAERDIYGTGKSWEEIVDGHNFKFSKRGDVTKRVDE